MPPSDFLVLRSAVRLLAALVLFAVGMVGCVVVLAAKGEPGFAGSLIALGVMLLGFLGLSLSRVPHAPWRPLRLALGVSILNSLYLLSALPMRPRGVEAVNAAILLSVALASLAASVMASRAPRLTATLLALLACVACSTWIYTMQALTAPRSTASGPALTVSYLIVASLGTAWLSALWHGRRLWQNLPTATAPSGPR